MRTIGRMVVLLGLLSTRAAFARQDPEVRQAPGATTAVEPRPTPPLPEGSAGLAYQ